MQRRISASRSEWSIQFTSRFTFRSCLTSFNTTASHRMTLPCLLCHVCTTMYCMFLPALYSIVLVQKYTTNLYSKHQLVFALRVSRSTWTLSNRRTETATETATERAARTRSTVQSGAREAKTILIWSPSFKRWVGE